MANPSLQIGNSNWAIKEDNLLGYSTAGTRFVPQPITMTRESAGTRVNPEGLVETVELLGSEEVTNGDFATDSDWTKGTGWTISGGTANANTSGSYINFYQNSVFTIGKAYKYEFTILNYSQGEVRFTQGGVDVSGVKNANGTYTGVFSASQTSLYFQGVSSFIGSIDNVSVKEVTRNNLARVDYDGTASSLLVEPERTNLITYSEDLSQGIWVGRGFTKVGVVAGALGQNGYEFLENNSDLNPAIYYNGDTSDGNPRTLGVWLKSSSPITIALATTGNVKTSDVNVTTDWQFFQCTDSINASQGAHIGGFSTITRGSGVSIYVSMAQTENGSYATSYIPTSGSTVTRVQDQYSKTGISNLINSEEGVLFLEVAALSNDGSYRLFQINDSTSNNMIAIGYTPVSNQLLVEILSGGSPLADLLHTTTDVLLYNKIALKWKVNDVALWVNGFEVGIITNATMPIGLNKLDFAYNSSLYRFYGKVKQLQVFKTALTDSELIALTTI